MMGGLVKNSRPKVEKGINWKGYHGGNPTGKNSSGWFEAQKGGTYI